VGIKSFEVSCSGNTPEFSVVFKNDASFSFPIALGTYVPTAGPPASTLPVAPGLSPAGVTPCFGTNCIVPDHDTDFNYWPVTVYWMATSGGEGGFTYNSDTSFTLDGASAGGFNQGSHLSNFADPGADDIYVPPSAVNIPNLPAPCWPTFDASGNLTSCAPTITSWPAYVAYPNYKPSGIVKALLKITDFTANVISNSVTIWGAF
jgi:hypothetical protein